MIKKITTLLLAAMIVISFAFPAVNAAGSTDCNTALSELNEKAFNEILNNNNCNVADVNELKETVLNQLNQMDFDCTPEELLNMLNENCNFNEIANVDAAILNDLLNNAVCTQAEPVAANTAETTEVPPEAAQTAEKSSQKSEGMDLTLPTVEATPQAQPIPTDVEVDVEPIPTEADEVEVTKVVSTPKVAETPAPTVEPTAEPKPEPTAEPTAAPTQAPAADISGVSDIERKMVDMVNEDRAAAGLAPLTIDTDLTYHARLHSKDMSENNFFSHTSPYRGSFSERLRNADLDVMGAGENIAMYGSVAKAQAALMASDGHRANILGNFTHVGIGIVYNEAKGAYYITQWFGRK